METNLQVFTNEEFGDVRTVVEDGIIKFIAADCCGALEIKNPSDTLKKLDDDEKGIATIYTLGGAQKMLVVTEAGLYRLIFMSRKPNAKKFQRWIFHEVIPAIRQHGYYAVPNVAMAPITPEFLRQIADAMEAKDAKISELEEKVGVQNQQIAEMKPKASYYDVILNCKGLVPISKIAKDYGMSAIKMNQLLHELGVQYKQGETWLLYQGYAERGWTQTKTPIFLGRDGKNHSKVHTYWTQKGRLELYELLKQHGYLPLIEQEDDEPVLIGE